MLFTYFILRYQDQLPLNPQHLPGLAPAPRVQHRRQLHDEHQLAELRRRIDHVVFLPDGRADVSTISPRPPPASRSRPRSSAASPGTRRKTIGNFWADVVRVTYYLLVPLCLVFALFLVSQGMIQNFKPYDTARRRSSRTRSRCRRPTPAGRRSTAPTARRRSWSTRRSTRRRSCRARWPRRSRSRCWARTAAATRTPMPRIRSRTRPRSRTSSRCSRSSRSAAP